MRKAVAWFILACGWLLAGAAMARDFKVEPGEVPELREGEGFVLVAIDTDQDVKYLGIKSEDRLFTGGRLEDVEEGQSWGLYVMPAGTYRWDAVHIGWLKWVLRDPDLQFTATAGEVTYAGDLVYRGVGGFLVSNRGLAAMDWLETHHPAIAAKVPFRYTGRYPDPFTAFYLAERKAAGAAPGIADRTREPPAAGPLPMPVGLLWRESRVRAMAMNESGQRIAGALYSLPDWVEGGAPEDGADAGAGDGDAARESRVEGEANARWSIEIYDMARGDVRQVARSYSRIEDLRWIDDDTLAASLSLFRNAPSVVVLMRFKPDGGFETLSFRRAGMIVDTLPDDPGHVLFASRASRGEVSVHRVDVRSQAALDAERFLVRDRLNSGLSNDYAWFTDGTGQVRAAIESREEGSVLVWGRDGDFQPVLTLDDPEGFQPMLVSGDGSLIYGTIESGRAQRELVEFDPVQKKVTRTLWSKPGVDIVGPIFDRRHALVGATYYASGQLVADYFDDARRGVAAALARAFPGRTVATMARSTDGQRVLVLVDGSDQPAQFFHIDRQAGRAELVEESAPWLSGKPLAPSLAMKVRSRDGLEIDAFLTLPPGTGKRPLVVMPHGGPIGVADARHFTPEVQFIASLGYAVLQVNFRGSEGYGRAFEEAGHRNYGRGIEDDIDAAIDAALARHPVDAGRMCMVGASYGGYSGLMSALRHPGRFRCVVSMSGVSDRTLFFTASDSAGVPEVRAILEKVIGNPNTEPELMRETSPLFRYRELDLPLMLVHGGQDLRVDYEHTRRLVRMLTLAGRPPVLLHLPEEGHGIEGLTAREKTWEGVAGFLRQHLGGAPAAGAAP